VALEHQRCGLRSGCQAPTAISRRTTNCNQAIYSAVFRKQTGESGLGETWRWDASVAFCGLDPHYETNRDLVTAYPVKRPDGGWSLMIINKDPSSAHQVGIGFEKEGKGTPGRF
jgi:hypothetical protein